MKIALFFLAAIAIALGSYSGDIQYGRTWTPPAITGPSTDSTSTCGTQASADKFVNWTQSWATQTVVNIQVMFEKTFRSSGMILVFTGAVDPVGTGFNPCTAIYYADNFVGSGSPPIFDYLLVPAGTYTFVVSGDGTVTGGNSSRFTASVTAANFYNNTGVSTTTWSIPEDTGSDCTASSTQAKYSAYTWVSNMTGRVDIFGSFVNRTINTQLALYESAFPNVTASPSNPCSGKLVYFSADDDGPKSDNDASINFVNITSGNTYTLVISGQGLQYFGAFGVFIKPSTSGDTEYGPTTFVGASISASTTTTDCETSSTAKKWRSYVFTAIYPIYIADVQAGYDSAAVLYRGVGNDTVAPADCTGFIIAGDTGDGGPLVANTIVGNNYTVIITGYSSGSGDYTLWILGGTALALPPTTPAPKPTTAPTPSTGGSPTPSTGGAPTPSSSTTSTDGVASVVASWMLVMITLAILF